MRILIYGAGAIGGYLGALLQNADADVTLVARGSTLVALQSAGLRLHWAEDGRELNVKVKTSAPDAIEGQFDLVFVTLKSMQLASAAQSIVKAVRSNGSMVLVQNGLPWWYFERIDSPFRGTQLKSLDPTGELNRHIDLDKVVGAVIYKPAMTVEPGKIFLPDVKLNQLIVGEVDGSVSARLEQIVSIVSASGLPTIATADIRAEKWGKLMLNLIWNPLSALTQSPSGSIAAFGPAADLVRKMTAEGAAVAKSVGVPLSADAEAELRRVKGNFSQQPSMLQDVRAGRPLEWEAILGSVIEIAQLTKVEVPTLETIAACVGVLDQRIRSDGCAIRPTQ